MLKKVFITCIVILSMNSFVLAATSKTNGFYFGGNIGYAEVNETPTLYNGQNAPGSNNGFGWNITAGYFFNKYIGLEAAFLGYPNENFDPYAKGSNNYAAALLWSSFSSLGGGFDFGMKVGVAAVHHKFEGENGHFKNSKINETRTAFLFWPEIRYAITPNFGVNVGGNITTRNSNIPSMLQATVGFSYFF